MKSEQTYIHAILVLLLTFCTTQSLHAQNEKTKSYVIGGLNIPFLDTGIGVNVGINTAYNMATNFSLEGHSSVNYTKITNSFLGGREGHRFNFNLFAGGRLYFMPKEKNNRLFINFLTGIHFYQENFKNVKSESEFTLGLSTGLYYEIKEFIIGVALESPGYLALKGGLKF